MRPPLLPALLASGRLTGAWGRGAGPDAMSGATPSGMIQGVVLSAILRLSAGRPSPEAQDVLERGFDRLARPVEHGGTISRFGHGVFVEEFPRTPPSHILNGCVYGLFGMYDLSDALGHPAGGALAARIEDTLVHEVQSFTTRLGWSRYAIDVYGHRPLASAHYHRAHIGLLWIVAQRTGSGVLEAAVERWRAAGASPATRALSAMWKTSQSVYMRQIRHLPLRRG